MKPTARPYQSIAILELRIVDPSQTRLHPSATCGREQRFFRQGHMLLNMGTVVHADEVTATRVEPDRAAVDSQIGADAGRKAPSLAPAFFTRRRELRSTSITASSAAAGGITEAADFA